MSFRFKQEESPSQNLRRIALEQVDAALTEIRQNRHDHDKAVHKGRKRCKKLRGLVRLVRPGFAAYASENKTFRDAARLLAPMRDAQSVIESFDTLTDHFSEQLDHDALTSVRQALTERKQRFIQQNTDIDQKLDDFLNQMLEARKRISHWTLENDETKSIVSGIRLTYKRGRKGEERANAENTAEARHEWRKRVKYHSYHLGLLTGVWPEMMKVQRKQCKVLADLLGDDHDLVVLGKLLFSEPDRYGSQQQLELLSGLIYSRQQELRTQASAPGKRLFAESPSDFADRIGHYWRAWHPDC